MIAFVRSLSWTPYGIQCPSAQVAHNVHQFLRQAILDRHVYITKIVGFSLESDTSSPNATTGEYIARHEQIGESYTELMVKLHDKVFLNTDQKQLTMTLSVGSNDLLTNQFNSFETASSVEVLYTNPYICRCLKKSTRLKVALLYDCGYKHMSITSKNLEQNFFPCNVDFSLADFYRVLPIKPGDTLVPIRYYNGATEAQLKEILDKWNIYTKTGNIKKEERLWLQSFAH